MQMLFGICFSIMDVLSDFDPIFRDFLTLVFLFPVSILTVVERNQIRKTLNIS